MYATQTQNWQGHRDAEKVHTKTQWPENWQDNCAQFILSINHQVATKDDFNMQEKQCTELAFPPEVDLVLSFSLELILGVGQDSWDVTPAWSLPSRRSPDALWGGT